MFLRHLILASTLLLSVPSISLSSASDIPEKLGGGWGGGTEKGTKGKGGNMKGALAPEALPGVPPAAAPAVAPAVAPGDVDDVPAAAAEG